MGMGPEKPVQVTPAPGFAAWPGPWDVVSLNYCFIDIPGDAAADLQQ